MTGSNKILTVSYGTFSCTLEGFDDPFGTMRGIAEYFRDLAADDRYFGAEPPTPDVEMLQNIAQKAVQRRVEARIGDAGVSLQQVEDAAEAEPAQDEIKESPSASMATAEEPAVVPSPKPRNTSRNPVKLDSGPLTFDDDFLMADEPEDVLTIDAAAEPVASDAPVESVAEKLRRIRAVVSRSIEPEEQDPSFSDAPASGNAADADMGAPNPRSRALSETIAAITADLADDEDAQNQSGPISEADSSAEIDDSDDSEDLEDPDSSTAPNDNATLDNVLNIVAGESGENTDDHQEDVAAFFESSDPEQDDFGAEDQPEEDLPTELHSDVDTSRLDAANEEPEDLADPEEGLPTRARRVTSQLQPIAEEGEDVGRLLQETDNQLKNDEGIRRRRLISQMRAAVAAKKAERIFADELSPEDQDKQDQQSYRADLNKAISRQPVQSQSAPKTKRPPPLVLISSQRVDSKPANDDEIHPKRVEKPEVDAAKAANFKDFASKMGAVELPDLLEAAAAYTAFVEGQPHFSRPEIMKRVARVDPALQVSREAGLRSFGQLLRQGKIQKLQRGQFTIDENTRFNPAQRIAGE
ncbi:MAG: hypothetical protein GKR98_02795 [Boseongicola sp.]|nr:MAG: hypothetical protein GKR98_02795 [Boseongicola sp.]